MFYHENWFCHNLTISKFTLFFLEHFSLKLISLSQKYQRSHDLTGWPTSLSSTTGPLTQSLSNNKLRDCQCCALSSPTVRFTQSLTNNKLRLLFGFFHYRLLTQASLFRGFALKKPLTFVRGFVARSGFEPETSGL